MTPLLSLLLMAIPQDPPAQAPAPMPVPRAVVAARGERTIVVDGSLLDWPDLPPLELQDQRQLSGTAYGAWRGPDDLSAMAFLLWDSKHLYFAASVQDDWHRALDARALQITEIPPADSIVLTFDAARDTRHLGPDIGRTEDAEFWLAEEHSNQVVRWDRLRGAARGVDDGRQVVSHDKERGLTTYEARIPWSDILPAGHEAAVGLVFDLQVVINDYDESTDSMPQTRIGWTFGCGPRIDPGLLGSVMLVGDLASLGGTLPAFPAPPAVAHPAPPGPDYWDDFTARLGQRPPAVFTGEGPPEAAGGLQRLPLLEEMDRHCEMFPRVDYLEFNHRVHRRMTREVAGAVQRGLPAFWYRATQRLSRQAEAPVPAGGLRLFRIPQGGWLVRGAQNFGIDPAGPELAQFLWGGMEFVIQTQPLDMTRRNDQLLVRMAAATPPRPFLSHAVFHLPLVQMADLKVVEPGGIYGPEGGAEVRALGTAQPDGAVPFALGYRVQLPGGRSIVIAGPGVRPEELPDQPCDVCLLSVRNPRAAEVGRASRARLVVLDDLFLCQAFPGIPRNPVTDGFALQRELAPLPSLLLAPGESWDIR